MITGNMRDHEVKEAVAEVLMAYATTIADMCAEKGVETDVVAETKALVTKYLGDTGENSYGGTAVSRTTIGGTSSIGVQEPAVVRNARRETAEASSPV